MAEYQCGVCGYVFSETDTTTFSELPKTWKCPVCLAATSQFSCTSVPVAETEYLGNSVVDEIHYLATTGKSITEPMDTLMRVPSFDDILVLGAQLASQPLDDGSFVNVRTIIGRHAKKPMVLETPMYISHMSFGALSREAKIALAKGSALAKTAMCSGEGGILPEEKAASYKYIFEYVPNLYSVTDLNLSEADAIEIKIGQGTKPGMGGHLPGKKVTEEIAKIRGKPVGEDVVSPSHFPGLNTPENLKSLIASLRDRSGGRPIGVKIAAGHVEEDLAFIVAANPDFVTIDGRGGATGSSPKFLKDASSVPTVYALARAAKFLREHAPEIDLVITGGLRTSKDFVKALALGADAVAVSSAALIALGCNRHRVCHNGRCPAGIATQDETLRANLSIDEGALRVANFFAVSTEELRVFARVTGHVDIHDLSVDDLATVSSEIAGHTEIPHV
ncbi:glutamate synthase-related protein [Methanorbis rubei]|uniref:Archaeal glutamate synthase [NADPH] n=1 Tax=Methanorbis rubei TaxID=3028300 RepID=A0AAE4MG11_9EURY|nr:hypothetical protein [Methanocorpusculaceae archaeon Cs1]